MGVAALPDSHRKSDERATIATRRRWAGRVISTVPVLFLIFDSVIKLMVLRPVAEAFGRLGIPLSSAVWIGALELFCLAIYLIPRTAVVGAVLLTGFLGGAIAIHVRVGDPLFSHTLFPAYVATLLWLGLYLRDPGMRAIIRPPGD